MIIVADTGPINYLILSGHVHLLPELYGQVLLPPAVLRELGHPRAPELVRAWAISLPAWATKKSPASVAGFDFLGAGEREALCLAKEINADFLLMDETLARRVATENSLAVKGSLGVLEDAAIQSLLNLPEAVQCLRATGIYLDERTVAAALERDSLRRERT